MNISILSAESLGVRGLCCHVETRERNILIDPGLALGYMRHKLLPHPRQVLVAEKVRRKIITLWGEATDIVFSHFHGDHVPLVDANPYQLRAAELTGRGDKKTRIWCKNQNHLSPSEAGRMETLKETLGLDFLSGEDMSCGPLRFSCAVPHGDPHATGDMVMMTLVEEDRRFLHASDIQLLNHETVSKVLAWRPDILLAGGPPLYLSRLSERQIHEAWENALRLARGVGVFILDHHLLRCSEGMTWLKRLSMVAGKPVLCAADFIGKKPMLLEAERQSLYRTFPVSQGWHEDYAQGKATTENYQ